MPLKIYSEKNIDFSQWDNLTNHSLYSSPEFVSIWKSMNGKPTFIVDEVDGTYLAGISGLIYGRRFFRRFQSQPDGFKGGFFFKNELSDNDKMQFVEQVADWLKSASFIRADIHAPDDMPETIRFVERRTDTHFIDLSDDFDDRLDKNIKKHIRTGERRGSEIVDFESEDQLDQFYDLVVKSEKRHGGSPRYPKEFFVSLYDLKKKDDRIGWLAAYSENILIGSKIYFIDGEEIFFWQGYLDSDYFDFKSGYLMNIHCFEIARANNIKSINLGWSPPSAVGLHEYKEKWGGVKRPFHYYTFYGGLGKLLYQWRNQ